MDTQTATYSYRVMPFGLKNAGATYKRLMYKMFRHQKGLNVEVYIDELLAKSCDCQVLIEDLSKTFSLFRLFNMKLNPLKCVFGAQYGKFLGYILTPNGIIVMPNKVQAIL